MFLTYYITCKPGLPVGTGTDKLNSHVLTYYITCKPGLPVGTGTDKLILIFTLERIKC